MTTNANFVLGQTFQQSLALQNVHSYAFAFSTNAGTLVSYIDLSQTQTLSLPSPNFSSGSIIVAFYQYDGNPSHAFDPSVVTDTGWFTPDNAKTYNLSYQLFEATMDGSDQNLGDISSLNSFGFASYMQVTFNNAPPQIRGYKISGGDLFSVLTSANPAGPTLPSVWVSTSNGSSFLGASQWSSYFAPTGETPMVGDFNGDGKSDIISFTQGFNGVNQAWVGLSSGQNFGAAQQWSSFFALPNETPGVGDFNGDGKSDIVTFTQDSNGQAQVFVGLSNGVSFNPAQLWSPFFGTAGQTVETGDFNGDGKSDIIAFARGARDTTQPSVWVALSNGQGFGSPQKWSNYFAPSGETPLVGDVNGDGKTDIVSFTQGSNGQSQVWVALSIGTAFASPQLWSNYFATAGQTPEVADVNGDGNADIIAFTRGQAGTNQPQVFVSLSTGSGFSSPQLWNTYFAPNGETPMVGNFTGAINNGYQINDIISFTRNAPGAVQSYINNQLADPYRMAIGPGAGVATENPWPASDWKSYVNALKANPNILNDIEIVTNFTGSPDQSTPMISHYGVQYVANDSYGSDYFWLYPIVDSIATNTDWIRVSSDQLQKNIYIQPGPLEVRRGGKDGPVVFYTSFTPNNAIGSVSKYFVAGFDAGYWGSTGTSSNPLVPTPINLNKSWNWSYPYAYGGSLLPGAVTVTNSLGAGPGMSNANNRFYDPYAAIIVGNSNAYGYAYSDLLSAGGVNPQLTMWDQTSTPPANVANINIGLYDNNDVTQPIGYQQSSTGYVAPVGQSYGAISTTTTNQLQIDFGYGYGLNGIVAPNAQSTISFKIWNASTQQLEAVSGLNQNFYGNWYYYNLTNNGSWQLTPTNHAGTRGFFGILNLPTTADGSPAWFQLTIGSGASQSIYNIYTQTDPNNSNVFTDVTVDHGVTAQKITSSNYTINFAPSGSQTYSNSLISTVIAAPQEWSGYFATAGETPEVGDFNGDGADDIIAFTRGQAGTSQPTAWVSLSNTSTNNFSAPAEWDNYFAPSGETPLVGDFNGDHYDDIIAFTQTSSGSSPVYVALNNQLSQLINDPAPWNSYFAPMGQVAAVGDFNGDGKDDIIAFTQGQGAQAWVSLSNGTGFGPNQQWSSYFSPAGEIPLVGDFNGDGKADILAMKDLGSNQYQAWVALSTGAAFGNPSLWGQLSFQEGSTFKIGDINGDGLRDITAFQQSSASVFAAMSTGSGFNSSAQISSYFAPNGETPMLADVFGQKISSLITFTQGSPNANQVWVGANLS